MKKNFLIMLLTVFCAGFAFAQDDNTVRGFVPGAGTGNENGHQTYAVFGQTFGDLQHSDLYEVADGLAQAQLIADTVVYTISCGDSIQFGNKTIYADELFTPGDTKRDTFLTLQQPNHAIYNYDELLVMHLYVCPCTVQDCSDNVYEVFSFNNLCWTKTSMRANAACASNMAIQPMEYETDLTQDLNDSVFGLLYTWENALAGNRCDTAFIQGICPNGWHLPTAAEIDTILKSKTNDLRSANGYWVLPEGITNATRFTAEPIGYYSDAKQRFEGHHAEVDFWYVQEGCTPNYFQILYYCDMPKQEPRNVNTDAMSVRCVMNMLDEYEEEEEEEEDAVCPEIQESYSFIDNVFTMPIYNYNTNVITGVTVNYYVMTTGTSPDIAQPISGTYEVENPDNDNAPFTFRSTLPSSIIVSELGQDDMIYIQIQFQINQDYADQCDFTNQVYGAIYPQN